MPAVADVRQRLNDVVGIKKVKWVVYPRINY